jgi:hypothetical protein
LPALGVGRTEAVIASKVLGNDPRHIDCQTLAPLF